MGGFFSSPTPTGSLVQRELSAQLTEGLSDLHSESGKSCGVEGGRCVVLLWGCTTWKGKPPARVSPLFGGAKNSPLPALLKHRGVSPSADGDQGLCPWNPLPFLREEKEAKKSLMRPAGLDPCYRLRFTEPASRSRPRSTAESSPPPPSVRSRTPCIAVPRRSGRYTPSTGPPLPPVWG